MIEALAALTVAILAALLITQHTQNTRHLERLLDTIDQDRDRTNQLVADLCQRIQAPAQAVINHSLNQPLPPLPQAVTIEDDADFWKAKNDGLELSKDELAEQVFASEQAGN